jgi:2-dehydro-3-deoxyphosphogluconate aldolase/(4S)-4-hydroxy-2-oxoglutarate aldolase
MMPSGGVTLTNAGDWLKVGACAVGVGGALLDSKAIADNNFAVITENAKILMASINNYRNSK